MSIAQVNFNGIDGTLYAEVSRSDDLANPFRQVIMRLYRFDGELRLRTLEFRGEAGPMLAGMSYLCVCVCLFVVTLDRNFIHIL
ncbi:MAG: hypothetical protein AAF138_06020, partial [Planctomycetota bacterium]